MSSKSGWCEDTRGVSEVIFIALLTLVVAGIGAAGVALASDITTSTAQQSEELDFELVSVNNIAITYEEGPVISSSNTQRLVLTGGDAEHVIYESSDPGEFRTGQFALTTSDAESLNITNDMTVQLVWEHANGDSKIVETIYIPDDRLEGTTISSQGSVNMSGDVDFEVS